MSTSVVTARLDAETLGQLDKLAGQTERSRAWLVAKAVKTYVGEELEHRAFVQEGIDAADRGDLISQEDMEAWFEARYRQIAAE